MTATNEGPTMDKEKDAKVTARAEILYKGRREESLRNVDRRFVWVLTGQWVLGILFALLASPYAWEGKVRSISVHVPVALFLGGGIILFPILAAIYMPGKTLTRHSVAVGQMLGAALLIHLTGGRIETHFGIFGSLAFLAFYFDWRVLITATVVVAADHLVRGVLWPESVYGVVSSPWWRFLEHAGWVVYEDIVLIIACLSGVKSLKDSALKQAQVEVLSESEQMKTAALEMTLAELRSGKAKI